MFRPEFLENLNTKGGKGSLQTYPVFEPYDILNAVLLACAPLAIAAPITTTSTLNPFFTPRPNSQITVESNRHTYVASGNLTSNETMPYTPYGGLNTDDILPVYAPLSDFDYKSLTHLTSTLN